jgi:hypothetical protein
VEVQASGLCRTPHLQHNILANGFQLGGSYEEQILTNCAAGVHRRGAGGGWSGCLAEAETGTGRRLACETDIAWGGAGARNVNAYAQLFAAGGIPIGDPVMLTPDQDYEDWTASISDQGGTPSYVVFTWDYFPNGADLGFHWETLAAQAGNPPGQAAAITSGTNLVRERVQNDN